MTAPKYEQVEDGEWITPLHRGYRQQCCDCGLVHVYRFRVTESGAVEFQVRRDNRATAQVRRHLRAHR
jgi:hypothetical protein